MNSRYVTHTVSKPLRILLVEDSEDDAELLVCHLERHNYDVEWLRVETPEAMSSALDRQQWDIILADYSLPKFNATAALHVLQSKALDIPFIIVSGNIGEETAVAAMKAGAHDYIMKGNLARLVPAIEREIEEAASRRERQRIQLELKESEARWHLALDGANDGLWDWDIKNHTAFLSARWKAMLGYAENEIDNRFEEWANRVHPDDVASVMRSLQEHLARQTEFYRTEHRLRCKDGTYKWILSRGKVSWDETGAAIRMVGSHTDITSTKQMEDTLRQQAESLTAANRIKDEFLAVVSHELRAPLNAILGWSQILRTRKFTTTTKWEILDAIERNAKWQQHLIEDLLDVSRIVQGTLELQFAPVYLPSIIAATVKAVQPMADAKRIQLKFTVDPDWEDAEIERQILLLADSNRLQQVFWNLLSNAIKFSAEGQQADICLSLVADDSNSQSQIYSYAQIQIIDRGQGISAEFLPHVFDRFRQENSSSARSHGGLGLGLAIVRHIVEMHGGTVGVASDGVGQGATFTVQLPLPKQKLSQNRQPSPADLWLETSEPYPLVGRKVLAVDDEPDTLELLAVALTEYGAEIVVAGSVPEAIAAFTQFKPDIMVCDLGMPGEDGYALIHQIRMLEIGLGTHTPAIALTGFARESDRDRAIAAGFQIHLSKPVNPYQLMSIILKLTKDSYLAGKI
ncbi:hybrid sensor histidine kinase/response regulator [Chroococcidiopsis sp. CCALA 051]|uniref:hybrid sensor histidine kinase/response regulator n=1 Tax=Chroococcidiopsis sp. CCALA 051 TaxID=869949 RepID=UPI000D0CE366|nr:response regulator [Chroococcidiopsis sp. CCALA 051]PSM49189.1 hybrid sensor histidine kinase/response regulator [Chroococcidiopsis sp. CCALA 051]